MDKSQKMQIRTYLDIILARSRVREAARAMGLGTTDQARISLAMSSLAYALGLGEWCQGEIAISCLNGDGRAGVCVTCTTLDGANAGLSSAACRDARLLVDELTVDRLPSSEIQATLIQWVK
jgi:hypothetical protein